MRKQFGLSGRELAEVSARYTSTADFDGDTMNTRSSRSVRFRSNRNDRM